mgnify:CR=1 FL=1
MNTTDVLVCVVLGILLTPVVGILAFMALLALGALSTRT